MEKIKTQILRSINFSENRAVYEIMWKNMVEPDRPQGQYGTEARTHTHTHTHTLRICNVYFFCGNNSYANVPKYYITHTLPVLLHFRFCVTFSISLRKLYPCLRKDRESPEMFKRRLKTTITVSSPIGSFVPVLLLSSSSSLFYRRFYKRHSTCNLLMWLDWPVGSRALPFPRGPFFVRTT